MTQNNTEITPSPDPTAPQEEAPTAFRLVTLDGKVITTSSGDPVTVSVPQPATEEA
ncbi:hypothetical protein [Azospirillum sp. B2RO_4]|uniref:hypothetical protein n=1 Tax=Azospirillum sp. B2RO_4 TaxID=3027796 RepID=UPI003DA8CD33